jgi:type I restriction enzyme M protein
MALKKSELYSSLWASCDELRGGMDASQYKDYVLVLLFVKYVSGLARMNMILHDYATADIKQGNTIASPLFLDGDSLKTFDYVVANPPFSDKRWSTGLDAEHDPWQRFQHYGIPPGKQGDFAYLLHILRSLKSTGKGACILPHGVLFRGGAESVIRRNLVQRSYLKGIIGLPANLFFGTGIPACIFVLDKEGAAARKSIFMIDASRGFIKDGNKNRLREQDIHKIVDIFTRQVELPRYSRLVPISEIADAKNDYNLNFPRYIDSSEPEDLQDIDGHLRGGLPSLVYNLHELATTTWCNSSNVVADSQQN